MAYCLERPDTGTSSHGSVFQLSQGGDITTLASFDLTNSEPDNLLQGSEGCLYGTTLFASDTE